MFEVITNTETRIVDCSEEQICSAMFTYIRAWRAAGKSLASAIYCFRRIPVQHKCPEFRA